MAVSSIHCPVWLLSYGTCATDHQALFVEITNTEGRAKGTKLHVQGPEDAPRQTRVSMWMEVQDECEAFEEGCYQTVGIKQLVGTIDKSDIDRLKTLCGEVRPPNVPQNHHPKPPNCRSWIKNVMCRCSIENLIAFESPFDIPTTEENLQI